MKGKIAFVLGAAVGYVLGTRAGRERYEQIKRGAITLWETAPVQRGAQVVRDAAQARVDQVKEAAVQAGKGLLNGAFGTGGTTTPRPDSAPSASTAPETKAPTKTETKSKAGGNEEGGDT